MNVKQIIKKGALLPKKASTPPPLSKNGLAAKAVIEKTEKLIKDGLAKPTASTGTPIEQLHGGAKFMAQLSNIGGGSLESGGGGIRAGFNTTTQNAAAKSVLKVELKHLPK